jgi:hypothetical protein
MPVSSGKPEGGGPELGGAPDGYPRPEPDNGMSAPPEPGGEEEPEVGGCTSLNAVYPPGFKS